MPTSTDLRLLRCRRTVVPRRLQGLLLNPREPFCEPGTPEGWPQSFAANPAHLLPKRDNCLVEA